MITLLALSLGSVQDLVGFSSEINAKAEEGQSRNGDDFRMLVTLDNPQPNGDHWSIYVTVEEFDGANWNKTTMNITFQVLFYEDETEHIIIEQYEKEGSGFAQIDLDYSLQAGEYTIRARIDGVAMDWMKHLQAIPITERPPIAVATIQDGDSLVKELTVVVGRDKTATVVLDSSLSTDPDSDGLSNVTFTWDLPGESVTKNKTFHKFDFEAGDYNITLRASKDTPFGEMYTEDYVLIHVEDFIYLPDIKLTVSSDHDELELEKKTTITTLVENIGNDDVYGFDIYYYNWLGVFKITHIGFIPFGMNRTIEIDYKPTQVGEYQIEVVADPIGLVEESKEDNNADDLLLTITPVKVPDMRIETASANGSFEINKVTFITIVLRNMGEADAHNVKAYLFINSESMVNQTFDTIAAGEQTTMVYTWIPKVTGNYTAHIVIWINSTIHDNQYMSELIIIPAQDGETDDPSIPIGLVVAGSGLLLIAAGLVAVTTFENSKYKLIGYMLMTPLYTRLKKEDTLRHEVRSRVYKHITQHPGDSYASILHALDLKNGTLVHHLRTLERERYVKSKKDGKFKRFYPWGTKVGERDPNYLTDIQMKIIEIIKGSPGVSQANIANSLHKSRQSINYQIKVLTEAGLINVIKHGITTRCHMKET